MGRNDECFCGSGKKQKKCHSNVGDLEFQDIHILN
ncbi:SEC-C metal-binding domain-containing protein [Bacillus wiedmannii]